MGATSRGGDGKEESWCQPGIDAAGGDRVRGGRCGLGRSRGSFSGVRVYSEEVALPQFGSPLQGDLNRIAGVWLASIPHHQRGHRIGGIPGDGRAWIVPPLPRSFLKTITQVILPHWIVPGRPGHIYSPSIIHTKTDDCPQGDRTPDWGIISNCSPQIVK